MSPVCPILSHQYQSWCCVWWDNSNDASSANLCQHSIHVRIGGVGAFFSISFANMTGTEIESQMYKKTTFHSIKDWIELIRWMCLVDAHYSSCACVCLSGSLPKNPKQTQIPSKCLVWHEHETQGARQWQETSVTSRPTTILSVY